ncbi:MAG: hypothetical protein Q9218_007601 [Villophora microphyllina]
MFGLNNIAILILATLLPSSLVTCHRVSLNAREYGHPERSDNAKEYGYPEPSDNDTSLVKRTIWDLSDMTGGDKTIVIQAFNDMSEVVKEVVENPNLAVLANYFDTGDAEDVAKVFQTVQAMLQPGGVPNPPFPGYKPTNLNQVKIRRQGLLTGCGPGVLAFTNGHSGTESEMATIICDFGWNVLYRRLRQDLTCDKIGPKINYKMQFLGPLLLHEVL